MLNKSLNDFTSYGSEQKFSSARCISNCHATAAVNSYSWKTPKAEKKERNESDPSPSSLPLPSPIPRPTPTRVYSHNTKFLILWSLVKIKWSQSYLPSHRLKMCVPSPLFLLLRPFASFFSSWPSSAAFLCFCCVSVVVKGPLSQDVLFPVLVPKWFCWVFVVVVVDIYFFRSLILVVLSLLITLHRM